MRIIILTSAASWFHEHALALRKRLEADGNSVSLATDHDQTAGAEICFLLSYAGLVPPTFLAQHQHNIVVHASALPKGRGWSPLTWQILAGATEIPLTLFEAVEAMDAGNVYLRGAVRFDGHELLPELRAELGKAIVDLCCEFVRQSSALEGEPQAGEATHFARRTPADSELDPQQSLADLFDALRVADSERYPAFFSLRGHRYKLRIERYDQD